MPTTYYYDPLTGRTDCIDTDDVETIPISLNLPFSNIPFKHFRYPCTSLTAIEIKKVIFNDPATIVFWSDGTKTIVKCGKDDTFDKEKGLAMAVCKKLLGHNRNLRELKKWL